MDKALHTLDWSLVQAFLAVAETGSLSGAGRVLGTSQPTLGRQIKTIEAQLGAELFHRQPRGFALTQTGAELVAPAQVMRDAVRQITLTAAGQQARLEGTVRITASVATSVMHLPGIIADIRRLEPEIAIELVATNDSGNLLFREADIAVRMYRPTQEDMISELCGQLELGAFAAESYIARRGMPALGPEGLLTHDVIGYDRSTLIIDAVCALGVTLSRDFFPFRCDDQVVCWQMARAGLGIGFNQLHIGDADSQMRRVSGPEPVGELPVWLTAHPEVKKVPRIRRVFDFLRSALARTCAANP